MRGGNGFPEIRRSFFLLRGILLALAFPAIASGGDPDTIFLDNFDSGATCHWTSFVSPTIPGGCLIDDACYAPGETDPLNQGCRTCNPALSQTAWTIVNNGGNCSDANPCTIGDTCSQGVCQPTGVDSCDDAVDCTDDSCDPETGCFNDPQDTLCDDLLACTLNSCSVEGCDVVIVAGNCVVDGACYTDGELAPGNPCLACDADADPTAFSPLALNTECSPGACTSESGIQLPDLCNGAGTCVESGNGDCAPYDCSGGACLDSCGVSSQCSAGNFCSGSLCIPKKAAGESCGASEQCVSNFCVDNVCCQSACGGLCEQCAAGTGACNAVPNGFDPANECAQDPTSTCDQDGSCNGARACRLWASGTACSTAACIGGMFPQSSDPPDLCNGTGTCNVTPQVDCGAYLCNTGTGQCRTTCQFDFHCDAGFICDTGSQTCVPF